MTDLRRNQKCSQRPIIFMENTKFTLLKEDFLSNLTNKEQFIHLIGDKLTTDGCTVNFAEEDADVEIVKASLDASLTNDVTLIGEDTDLLVVLLLHFGEDEPEFKLYFPSDRENRKKENIIYDVNHYSDILGKKTLF